jgi:hypothetical protein
MNTPTLALALCGVVLLAACERAKPGEKDKADPKVDPKVETAAPVEGPTISREPDGTVVLHLPKEAVERMAIAAVPVTPRSLRPEVKAFGRVVENPDAMFTLRAPFAGVVQGAGAAWPTMGQELAAGTNVGSIEPRLGAVERADVAARLAMAKGDVASSQASLVAAEGALKRAQTLNAQDKNVSDRVVQEADAVVKSERAKLDASRSTVETLQALLEPDATAKASLPLVVTRAGEVVEVPAKPGENVDAGASILRLESFDEILARIDLPLEGGFDPGGVAINISPLARDDVRLSAQRRALEARVDPATQGRAWLVSIARPANMMPEAWSSIGLRPGQAIVARLPRAGAPIAGNLVPSSAVVRHAGKAWVWVQSADGAFARRPLDSNEPTPLESGGWFTTASWAKDARVVAVGAQALLSTELSASQKGGAEEP